MQNAATLCPSPWRVPSRNDFRALDRALGGDGNYHKESESWVTTNYINKWGAPMAASPALVPGALREVAAGTS
jgi:hypothetical protein